MDRKSTKNSKNSRVPSAIQKRDLWNKSVRDTPTSSSMVRASSKTHYEGTVPGVRPAFQTCSSVLQTCIDCQLTIEGHSILVTYKVTYRQQHSGGRLSSFDEDSTRASRCRGVVTNFKERKTEFEQFFFVKT
jgi:hypothetical protein